MKKDPSTVLVLGAGASKPYGLPLGFELRGNICKWGLGERGSIPDAAEQLLRQIQVDPMQVVAFCKDFHHSYIGSVDAFLAARPEHAAIGRIVIALQIAGHEDRAAFEALDGKDDWYPVLWNWLAAGKTSVAKVVDRGLRIITFNYDRSLEFFLSRAIRNTFHGSGGETVWPPSVIPILHVYGDIGEFQWRPDGGGRSYDSDILARHLLGATQRLQVIPEARDDSKSFRDARLWLGTADRIGFIGFGFDPLNCRRLGMPMDSDWCVSYGRKALPEIYASTFDRTQVQRNEVQRLICEESAQWKAINGSTIVEFLRECSLLS